MIYVRRDCRVSTGCHFCRTATFLVQEEQQSLPSTGYLSANFKCQLVKFLSFSFGHCICFVCRYVCVSVYVACGVTDYCYTEW